MKNKAANTLVSETYGQKEDEWLRVCAHTVHSLDGVSMRNA